MDHHLIGCYGTIPFDPGSNSMHRGHDLFAITHPPGTYHAIALTMLSSTPGPATSVGSVLVCLKHIPEYFNVV